LRDVNPGADFRFVFVCAHPFPTTVRERKPKNGNLRFKSLVLTMAKTRVATLLKDAVGGKSHNQSQDLVQLTEKYHVFVKRLQGLVVALKAHFASMQAIARTRYTVRRRIYVQAGTVMRGESVIKGRHLEYILLYKKMLFFIIGHSRPPFSLLYSFS
jgi:hypothetical protein